MTAKPMPVPDCPFESRVRDLVPMAHVSSVDQSIEFYSWLGFHCESRFTDGQHQSYYAALRSERAELMLARASDTVDAGQQAILLYMYAENIAQLREHLLTQGLADAGTVPGQRHVDDCRNTAPARSAVFTIHSPFYMPEGELRVHDPDGYVILIGQAERRNKTKILGAIGQIAITVADVAAAVVFYRDIIGFRLLFQANPNLAFLSDGSLRIMITTPQGAGTSGANSTIYVRVQDIEKRMESMRSLGATVERSPQLAAKMPDHDLWIGFLRDPEQNLVGLMEEKPAS